MNPKTETDHVPSTKIGFHYFQDTTHYTNRDLKTWISELTRLSASWLVLLSDTSRAIPEHFISGLIQSGITPIIHFPLSLPDAPNPADVKAILEAYARWGVRYVVFFDKPNDAQSWSASGWSHQDLVERFIDRFLPLAAEASRIGLTPVFPPLQPGGSYWDTSFFRSAVQSMQRRGQNKLLERMVFGAYAYTFGHELNWGAGGPEKWPQAKPYSSSEECQDQCGYNNYTWLQSIAQSLGLRNVPVMLFGTGLKNNQTPYSPEMHAEIVQSMIKSLQTQSEESNNSRLVLACNFWLLAADPGSEEYPQAWIKPGIDVLPIVRVLAPDESKNKRYVETPSISNDVNINSETSDPGHPIAHYLLLPTYEWGIADWHLDVSRPFIRKYRPTVGFSCEEAALARKVTVIGGEKSFSNESIALLRESGCVVDQIVGDGTSIATQLLER